MSEYLLLTLAERLLSLYEEGKIVSAVPIYTEEFKSLVGKFQDAVANVE